MATWEQLIRVQMSLYNETFNDVESSTLSADDIKKETDSPIGGYCGDLPFTIWTSARVYFPVFYDGKQWIESVARHPDGKPTAQRRGKDLWWKRGSMGATVQSRISKLKDKIRIWR